MATVTAEQEIVYSDVNLELGTTSNYELLYNEEAIRGAIINTLMTNKGTRPFRRRFGSSIGELLFAPLEPLTARRMTVRIKEDLQVMTDRVRFSVVEVIPDYTLDAYYVNIVCEIIALQRQFDVNFNLKRTAS